MVLITGSTGFIGNLIVENFSSNKISVKAIYRDESKIKKLDYIHWYKVDDLVNISDYKSLFENVETIIHCASFNHANNQDDEQNFKINFLLTNELISNAIRYEIKNFLYLSTVNVYGNNQNKIITESTECNPEDAYSKSKILAENIIKEYATNSCCNFLILRLALVYGEGVKGNFRNLLRFIIKHRCFLLANDYKRNYLYSKNLVYIITEIIKTRFFDNNIYNVSDENALSIEDIIDKIENEIKLKVFKVKINQSLLRIFLYLVGKQNLYEKLYNGKIIDSSKIKNKMNINEINRYKDGLSKTIKFINEKNI